LQIDHLLLSPSIAGRLVAAGVDRDVRARERSSDHAPVWIAERRFAKRKPRRGEAGAFAGTSEGEKLDRPGNL
jgi:exodeoxyribonuclease-3